MELETPQIEETATGQRTRRAGSACLEPVPFRRHRGSPREAASPGRPPAPRPDDRTRATHNPIRQNELRWRKCGGSWCSSTFPPPSSPFTIPRRACDVGPTSSISASVSCMRSPRARCSSSRCSSGSASSSDSRSCARPSATSRWSSRASKNGSGRRRSSATCLRMHRAGQWMC